MKPATSNVLHAAAACQGPSSNLTRIKSGCDPGLGELPKIWGFPFNISGTAEAIDFKFGKQLRFAKAHHKITPRGKSIGSLGLGQLPNILGFPYNISAMAGASDFKFIVQLGRKGGHGPGLVSSQNLGVSL